MHQEREIRQESYLATKYEKARQDVGLFLCLKPHINKVDSLDDLSILLKQTIYS